MRTRVEIENKIKRYYDLINLRWAEYTTSKITYDEWSDDVSEYKYKISVLKWVLNN